MVLHNNHSSLLRCCGWWFTTSAVLPLPRTRQVLEGTHRPLYSSPYRRTTSPHVITLQCNRAIFTFYDHLDNVVARPNSACFTTDDRSRHGACCWSYLFKSQCYLCCLRTPQTILDYYAALGNVCSGVSGKHADSIFKVSQFGCRTTQEDCKDFIFKSPWRCNQHVLPKRQKKLITLHVVTVQKNIIWSKPAVKMWKHNPNFFRSYWCFYTRAILLGKSCLHVT